MNIDIESIVAPGDLAHERVVLRANRDGDLGDYAVFSCRVASPGRVFSGDVPDVFWFESLEVKKGDFVILYTKDGAEGKKEIESGNSSYFYYWDRNQALWGPERRAILVNTKDWKSAT